MREPINYRKVEDLGVVIRGPQKMRERSEEIIGGDHGIHDDLWPQSGLGIH